MLARVLLDCTEPMHLSQSASRSPATPSLSGVSTRGSTLGGRGRGWLGCMVSRAISTVSSIRGVLPEETLHKERSEDEVSAATSKGRVEAGDEVVQMGTENTSAFQQHRRPTATDHGDAQHGGGQVNHRDVNDEESHTSATLILGKSPDQGHDQG